MLQGEILEGTIHFVCEVQRAGKRKRIDKQDPQIAGWSFRCNSGVAYLLSFPTSCYSDVTCAWKESLVVRLKRYTSLPLSTTSRFVQLVEVHEDGLVVAHGDRATENRIDKDNSWTLAKIALKEALDIKLQEQIRDYRPSRDSRSRKYSFRATIQAVTPILTLDPSDPFCLLHVDDEGYTSVLVFQKEALACCTLLIPGETCYLHDVTRIAWKVPDEMTEERFAHLKPHVPIHVFVAQSKHQIICLNSPKRLELPHSITGCITHVHTITTEKSGQGKSTIQYVDLVTDNQTNCRLYLEHFPMSTTTQLSLRSGASVLVIHIHELGQGRFATCLRSSLHICEMQPEDVFLDSHKLDIEVLTPFAYARIRKSCYETALSTLFSDFLDGFDIHDKPSLRHWTCSWLGYHGFPLVGTHTTKPLKRNVYAEFFDHQLEIDTKENVERCGCYLSRGQTHNLPFLLGLSDIQNEALRVLQKRLSQHISDNSVRAGWTASFSLVAKELNASLNVGKCSDAHVYSGGAIVSAAGSFQVQDTTTLLLAVSNGRTVLPISVKGEADMPLHSHVLFPVESVTTSVLCLGAFPKRENDGNSDRGSDVCILPMMGGHGRFHGPCALVRLPKDNGIFIVSFQLQASAILSVSSEDSIETETGKLKKIDSVPFATVAIPTFDASGQSPGSICITLLARKQYAFLRVKNGFYGGVTLTLSHMPSRKQGKDKLSDLSILGGSSIQSIDCRPPLELHDDARRQMEAFFSCSTISATGVLDEQIATALAFWKIASYESHCSMLSGGLDELTSDASGYSRGRKVAVLVPLNCFQRDPKRGYLRIRCNFEDIVAVPVDSTERTTKCTDSKRTLDFDFVGGGKKISGMMGRRPDRKQFGDIAIGELTSVMLSHAYDGVLTCSIGEMHKDICKDLQNSTCTHTAPSLTRRVIGGTFLGVSFLPGYCRTKNKIKQYTPAGTRKHPRSSEKSSFWNRALPPSSSSASGSTIGEAPFEEMANEKVIRQTKPPDKVNDLRSLMVCPKRCRGMTAIKWECSGTLDDSTGQAKLYAERDTALLLLGLKKEFVSMIEEGAWAQPDGVVFSKAMGPNSSITHAVSRAKYRAAEARWGCKVNESDVLKHMEPCARADYLLQRHCRFSPEPSRELIYYVLCKPMGDNSFHLKHTVVDLVSGQSVPTYTLPPLKLVLVDCHAVSSRGRQYDDDEQ